MDGNLVGFAIAFTLQVKEFVVTQALRIINEHKILDVITD